MVAEANPADEAEVIRLWHACDLTRPWNDPEADFRRATEGATSCVLVSRGGDGTIAGSAMVGFDGHRGWVYYLAVDPAWRGQGLGRKLMRTAEQWLGERGCPKIQLMVRTDNEAAKGFYAAIGYEEQAVATIGRRLD